MADNAALATPVLKHAKIYFASTNSDVGFDKFLNKIVDPASSAALPLPLDLQHPIAHYFISSSHNTYLTGNQLWSKSSTETYKQVLKQGCRCIEVDVWDGGSPQSSDVEEVESRDGSDVKSFMKKQLGRLRSHSRPEKVPEQVIADTPAGETLMPVPWRTTSNEPRVMHGHTATKEISFRKVCEIVREYAFRTTEMPLIVSLEVHCSPQQQEMMVEIMTDYWREYLADIPKDFRDSTKLPILEGLKRKILIKVKYSSPKGENTTPKQSPKPDDDQESSSDETPASSVKKGHIIEELSRMGIYTRACHFHDLRQPEAKIPTHIFAVSETKLLKLCEEQPKALFEHNISYLMRAYPKSTRLRSSNLDPAPLWRFGIQLVALNMQKVNAATMLNFAMFEGTGGWALKPTSYRSSNGQYQSRIPRHALDLSLKILAGQGFQTDIEIPNAYLKTELHVESKLELEKSQIPNGAKNKGGEWKHKSRAVHSCDPDFSGETVEFHGVKDVVPELSFVRFKVMHDASYQKDRLLGWSCYRLDRLPQGLLFLQLRGPDGRLTDGRLLLECKMVLY